MSAKLTLEQKTVLALFTARGCGAMKLAGNWVWAGQIRNDPDLAARFLRDRCEDGYETGRDIELLRQWLRPQRKDTVRQ